MFPLLPREEDPALEKPLCSSYGENWACGTIHNFHSLARDVELNMSTWKDGSHGLVEEKRMSRDAMDNSVGRKTVLLEKTNCLHEGQHSGRRGEGTGQHMLGGPFWKFGTGKQTSAKKVSAFTEVRQMKEKLKAENVKELKQRAGEANSKKEPVLNSLIQSSTGSAFSFVWPTRVEEPKSAFSKPAKYLGDKRAASASDPLSDLLKGPGKVPALMSTTDDMWYSSILTCKCHVSDWSGSQLPLTSLVQRSPLPYTARKWPRLTVPHMRTMSTPTSRSSSASLTLLPPTFATFGVEAQNWCAKCNLSFRMTSDLVLHMRSHHKKESTSSESQHKKRRGGKLACPVCQEYFQERHHLSRHMTAHN